MRRPRLHPSSTILALGLLALAAPARAQTGGAGASPEDPGQSGKTAASQPGAEVERESEIDIANIVQSVTRGVTTVQEAPAIITIVTGEEIKQQGFRFFGQVLGSIPGWINNTAEGDQVTLPQVRGTVQAALLLRDGVSMFDPQFNVATMSRAMPLETIKRVEVVTGPGGVLWGSNSFLGVVNVITKDAEDVNGLEMSAGYGDGHGDASDFRAYAMFGKTFLDNKLKVFLHASYENYLGQVPWPSRQFLAGSPAPEPAGPSLLSVGTQNADFARSWLLNLDGKITILQKLNLYFMVPFGEMNYGLTFNSTLITNDMVPHGNSSMWSFWERYGILEYKDRFLNEKLGLNVKGYYINFNRDLGPRIFPNTSGLVGGLTFGVRDMDIQRYGGTLDVDFAGPTWSWGSNRVLAGAEAFHEQSAAINSFFWEPGDPATGRSAGDLLPIVCPLQNSGNGMVTAVPQCPILFAGGAERTVAGLYLADQLRLHPTLTLDGGVRYQQGFGQRGYAAQVLGSAAAVWQLPFAPDFHLKLNWSQGFRPPIFNSTDGNGAAIEFGGNPKLTPEQSQSFMGELNARLLRNVRKVRELQLRIDYAYTVLDNLIIIKNGLYVNAGRRAINSVEFLGKLYLAGDHAITLGYTFLQIATSDQGEFVSPPRHFFHIGAVFNLVKNLLDVNGNLTVMNAYQDPNRYPFQASSLLGANYPGVSARASDLTYDRLTPVALLQLGARLRLWHDRIIGSAQFYNVLNQHYYNPDVFFDQAPFVETQPNPAPGFSFFASITYRPLQF
jgi:outer membrane receptor protein involved in Fe transport